MTSTSWRVAIGGGELGGVGLDGTADMAEEVQLPGGIEAGVVKAQSRVGRGSAGRARNPGWTVLLVQPALALGDGKQVRHRAHAQGARFEHVGGGDAQVLVGGDRALRPGGSACASLNPRHQVIPWRRRSQVGLVPVGKGGADLGLGRMEIRADGAAVQAATDPRPARAAAANVAPAAAALRRGCRPPRPVSCAPAPGG